MVLDDKVLINMNGKHISRYRELGYTCNVNETVEVKISDLALNSHVLVLVKCDVCYKIKTIKYQVYNKNFIKENYYACSTKCAISKYENKMLKKYGVVNYAKTEECREKTIKTCIERYGEICPSRNIDVMSKIKNTRIERGLETPKCELSDYQKYRKIIRKLTNVNKKILFENWNGFDYYDNEYIKDNFSYNSNDNLYPTIDHKISIFQGFKENIKPELISSIDNLCITKRIINSKKQANEIWSI